MVPFLHRASPRTMKENPLWLVVLCDMMTNLMLFFLVMYALVLQEPAVREAWTRTFDAKDLVEDPRKRRAEALLREFQEKEAATALKELLRRSKLEDAARVTETEEGIRVRLRQKLLFAVGEARLSEASSRTLALLARVLREMDNQVVVEGHADDVPIAGGSYRTNWELSVARAYSVIERLTRDGVAPGRLIASGYGERRPAASNKTPAGRELNRRVEIVILKEARDRAGGV